MIFEDIFYNITALQDHIQNKRVVVFGTGRAGKTVGIILKKLQVNDFYFVDNNRDRWQQQFLGHSIKDPSRLTQMDQKDQVILVASMYFNDISQQLSSYGFRLNKNFFNVLAPGVKLLNFDVNNVCNSRCTMCNVWRNKDSTDIDIPQFEAMLANSFFERIENIGLIGGEPTLEKKLPHFAQAAIDKLPNLRNIITITNALSPGIVIPQLQRLQQLCMNANVAFTVMLSLDGVGNVHDINRGVKGSFKNFETVSQKLRECKIPFITGSTITKHNVWCLDELLNYLKVNNIYGRFRIAEFIKRLNNHDLPVIRSFNEDEIYQLLLFFTKLETTYETDETIKNTYRSIKNVLSGGRRLVECPYIKQSAVYVDCHGELSYCAPKSDKVGNISKNDPGKLYRCNTDILESIKDKHCPNCIHDYQGAPTPELVRYLDKESYWRKRFTIDYYNQHKGSMLRDESRWTPNNKRRVFIVGWYGTETIGDKAILGQVVHSYREKYPDCVIAISSLYPFITERTIKELNIKAQVIPVFSESFFDCAGNSDEVIVGGGPLMELEELSLILWSFSVAKKCNKVTTVYGCGIGPLYSQKSTEAVKEILAMSDNIFLRDEASVKFAYTLTRRLDIKNIGDPAITFLRNNYKVKHNAERHELACFLRELTFEYRNNMNVQEFAIYKRKFEEALAENIVNLCNRLDLIPSFYSMHNFAMGNDDRDFNYYFTNKYFNGMNYHVENNLSTIDTIISAMQRSQYNLCMRFHSVVFASTMKTKFMAVDYTSGGKIKGFLADNNQLQHMVTMENIVNEKNKIATELQYLYKEYPF